MCWYATTSHVQAVALATTLFATLNLYRKPRFYELALVCRFAVRKKTSSTVRLVTELWISIRLPKQDLDDGWQDPPS